MTPEEKNMLERSLRLAQENNDLLRKMNRRAWAGGIFKVLYWLVILGITLGAYYFIQPYLDWTKNEMTYISGMTNGSSTAATDMSAFNSFMQKFK